MENLRQNDNPQSSSEIQTHKIRDMCTDVCIVPVQDIDNMCCGNRLRSGITSSRVVSIVVDCDYDYGNDRV